MLDNNIHNLETISNIIKELSMNGYALKRHNSENDNGNVQIAERNAIFLAADMLGASQDLKNLIFSSFSEYESKGSILLSIRNTCENDHPEIRDIYSLSQTIISHSI